MDQMLVRDGQLTRRKRRLGLIERGHQGLRNLLTHDALLLARLLAPLRMARLLAGLAHSLPLFDARGQQVVQPGIAQRGELPPLLQRSRLAVRRASLRIGEGFIGLRGGVRARRFAQQLFEHLDARIEFGGLGHGTMDSGGVMAVGRGRCRTLGHSHGSSQGRAILNARGGVGAHLAQAHEHLA